MFEELRNRYFPQELIPDITARPVDAQTFYAAAGALSGKIFESQTELGLYRPPQDRYQRGKALRQSFQCVHKEHILLTNRDDEPIGFSTGAMRDPDTFFMEWTGILPDYQRQGIYTTFLHHLLLYLRELGYERVTSNHMGTNRPVLIAKLKAGFNVTGATLDERYGMLVWLAYFLHADRQKGFEKAFSLEPFPQANLPE